MVWLLPTRAITDHKRFKASIYLLKKEEGGHHTLICNKYRPQFYLLTIDCTGEIHLPVGIEMVILNIISIHPQVRPKREGTCCMSAYFPLWRDFLGQFEEYDIEISEPLEIELGEVGEQEL